MRRKGEYEKWEQNQTQRTLDCRLRDTRPSSEYSQSEWNMRTLSVNVACGYTYWFSLKYSSGHWVNVRSSGVYFSFVDWFLLRCSKGIGNLIIIYRSRCNKWQGQVSEWDVLRINLYWEYYSFEFRVRFYWTAPWLNNESYSDAFQPNCHIEIHSVSITAVASARSRLLECKQIKVMLPLILQQTNLHETKRWKSLPITWNGQFGCRWCATLNTFMGVE